MCATRLIDFHTLSLKDALDLAILIEQEAKERYEEFAAQLAEHHNEEVARFFRFMEVNETKHEAELTARRKALFGDEAMHVRREMIFDLEAPEYGEVHMFMTPRQALETALRAEQKAYAFFDASLGLVQDAGVRKLFEELREEEHEHQGFVEKQLEKLEADDLISAEDVADAPVSQ